MGVEGLILAAGLSSRAHCFKMTLPFNGKTVIENTIDSMLEFCTRIIVVGGYKPEKLKPVAEKYEKVELVHNEDYLKGMYSSVQKGVGCIKEERFFFTPGDYPCIAKAVYSELLKHKAPVVIPVFEGRKGHPLLLRSDIIKEILQDNSNKTLREVLKNKETALVPVSCRGIVMDLDTLEDYKALEASRIKG